MPLRLTEELEEPNLNLTPMIDIVFLLIIFFMVGTQFAAAERQYDIKLPTVTDAATLLGTPDEIIVNVSADGTIALNGRQKTLEELEADLTAARQNYSNQAVVVRGHATGPYQHVMDVLAACHRAEINHIALANRLKGKDGG